MSDTNKKKTAEDLDREFGAKRWDGVVIEGPDGEDVLIAVKKPSLGTTRMVTDISLDPKKKSQANALMVQACLITHDIAEYTKLLELEPMIEGELAAKCVELLQSGVRSAKKA